MPLSVSVVTPSYNQGRFIEQTIHSVLSQRVPGTLQYLVMDGGSRDETVEILKRYDASLVWISEKDGGQAEAVNKGIARARGEIIGWLNSDDIYYPCAIASACEFFDRHPEADLVYGNANHIDEHGRIIEPYPTEDWDFKRLLQQCYLCQPAVFFRRRVVNRFGPLDARLRYCMDYEYWLRLAMGGARFARMEELLAGSRLYAETKTLGARVQVHREINDMMRMRVRQVPDRWLFNYAHALLDAEGVPRSDRVRFPLRVAWLSLLAALRWNRRISRPMAGTLRTWTGGALRTALKR